MKVYKIKIFMKCLLFFHGSYNETILFDQEYYKIKFQLKNLSGRLLLR